MMHADIWSKCLKLIEEKIPKQSFETWFKPIVPVKYENRNLIIKVPSQFFYEWIEGHYHELVRSALVEASDDDVKLVYSVIVDEGSIPVSLSSSPVRRYDRRVDENTMLNYRYNFDSFVEGSCNQFARAAAMAVAEEPGKTSFNPLVIYGGVGLGKTHLIQAIGNFARENNTAGKMVYISSEKFTIEFINAIQNNKTAEFSNFYRNVDLLLVDDIQFFMKKEMTQEQFFHTFNALHQKEKQIVLTSDRPPKDLNGMEERLISRFQSGLIADIQPPDLETRIAILQKKSEADGINIPYEVTEFLALNITSNIRELEGAMIRLLAYASLSNCDVNLDLAKRALREVITGAKGKVTIEDVQKATCEFMGVKLDDMIGKGRRLEVALARQIAMNLCRELTGNSLKTIGLHFGGRDHSTVIHACRAVEERIAYDNELLEKLNSIKKRLNYSQF